MATRKTHITDTSGRSEFTGEFRENTLPMKPPGSPLSSDDIRRLIVNTGTRDIEAPPNRRAWLGFKNEKSVIDFED